jgi:hypothetical protein
VWCGTVSTFYEHVSVLKNLPFAVATAESAISCVFVVSVVVVVVVVSVVVGVPAAAVSAVAVVVAVLAVSLTMIINYMLVIIKKKIKRFKKKKCKSLLNVDARLQREFNPPPLVLAATGFTNSCLPSDVKNRCHETPATQRAKIVAVKQHDVERPNKRVPQRCSSHFEAPVDVQRKHTRSTRWQAKRASCSERNIGHSLKLGIKCKLSFFSRK